MRIGVLIDSTQVSKYYYDITDFAFQQSAEIIGLQNNIIKKKESNFKKFINNPKNTFNKVLFRLLVSAEKKILGKRINIDHFKKFEIESYLNGVVSLNPNVSKSGLYRSYSDDDIQLIEKEELDLIIRFCSGIIRGGILNASKHGIFSFHHADNRENRGGPAGYWEVKNKIPTTGFIVQILNESLDGGKVILRGNLHTQKSYLLNQQFVYEKSTILFIEVLSELIRGKKISSEDNLPYSGPLYKVPGTLSQLQYLSYLLAMQLKKKYFSLTKKKLTWTVSVSKTNWRNLEYRKAKDIPNIKDRFFADPFLIEVNNESFCFLEDYDFNKNKGSISVIKIISEKEREFMGKILEEPFHLSFPFIFRYKDDFFMVPESHKARELRIYRCTNFPMKWELYKTDFHGLSIADPMIFEKDNQWWLFMNVDSTGKNHHNDELRIFFSDNPLGNWNPHPQNPVVLDAKYARNGGLIKDGELIYRISQSHGFQFYGKRSNIHAVKTLSNKSYEEELIHTNKDGFNSKALGTHHLDTNHKYSVFDWVSYS